MADEKTMKGDKDDLKEQLEYQRKFAGGLSEIQSVIERVQMSA